MSRVDRRMRWAAFLVFVTAMPLGKWFLPQGFCMSAEIEGKIYSYSPLSYDERQTNVPVYAVITEPARCPENGNVVLPKGTRFIGSVTALFGSAAEVGRISPIFRTAILPNGRSFTVRAVALSPDGSPGIGGKLTRFPLASGATTKVEPFAVTVASKSPCHVFLTEVIVLDEEVK